MVETPRTYLKIRHTIIDGSSIGVSIVNRTEESNNRVIDAEISDSVFRKTLSDSLPFSTNPKTRSDRGFRFKIVRE